MKNPDRKTVERLEDLPNVGKAMADSLRLVGIHHPGDITDENPYQLYEKLCVLTGCRHDPCVLDVFIAVIRFMNGGDPVPWWTFTEERKKHMKKKDTKIN